MASSMLCILYLYLIAAIQGRPRGKITQTAFLPGVCKIKGGGGSGGAETATTMVWLSILSAYDLK